MQVLYVWGREQCGSSHIRCKVCCRDHVNMCIHAEVLMLGKHASRATCTVDNQDNV